MNPRRACGERGGRESAGSALDALRSEVNEPFARRVWGVWPPEISGTGQREELGFRHRLFQELISASRRISTARMRLWARAYHSVTTRTFVRPRT